MLSKLKKSNSSGFTIIEVMIVLAIAGLILLIVFLAVPALQRNARNTQRKTDVGTIGAAANTIKSNNNGDVTKITTSALNSEISKLSYYLNDPTHVYAGDSAVAANLNAITSIDQVSVVTNAKCGATASANAVVASRQIAVLYATENGASAGTSVCVDL